MPAYFTTLAFADVRLQTRPDTPLSGPLAEITSSISSTAAPIANTSSYFRRNKEVSPARRDVLRRKLAQSSALLEAEAVEFLLLRDSKVERVGPTPPAVPAVSSRARDRPRAIKFDEKARVTLDLSTFHSRSLSYPPEEYQQTPRLKFRLGSEVDQIGISSCTTCFAIRVDKTNYKPKASPRQDGWVRIPATSDPVILQSRIPADRQFRHPFCDAVLSRSVEVANSDALLLTAKNRAHEARLAEELARIQDLEDLQMESVMTRVAHGAKVPATRNSLVERVRSGWEDIGTAAHSTRRKVGVKMAEVKEARRSKRRWKEKEKQRRKEEKLAAVDIRELTLLARIRHMRQQ